MSFDGTRKDPINIVLAGVASADLRTKPIRLVHEVTWQAEPSSISITSENNSEHESSEEFMGYMNEWIATGFKKLDYTVQRKPPPRRAHDA